MDQCTHHSLYLHSGHALYQYEMLDDPSHQSWLAQKMLISFHLAPLEFVIRYQAHGQYPVAITMHWPDSSPTLIAIDPVSERARVSKAIALALLG